MKLFTLSTTQLDLEFQASGDRLSLRRFGSRHHAWLDGDASSGIFSLSVDGQQYDAQHLSFRDFTSETTTAGMHHGIARFTGMGFEVDHHVIAYPDTALIEVWQVIHSTSAEIRQIARLESLSLVIPAAEYELLYFSSDWGQEFEPIRAPLTDAVILETRKGRSSKGQHPWFALFAGTSSVLAGSIAWSGNWVMRFEPLTDGGCRLSGGLHAWQFGKDLLPGAAVKSAHAVLALGRDLNETAQQFARVGRNYWYPRNPLSASAPVEWNHWWSYEDVDISEAVFRDNAAVAASLGVEVCTLDAGWFGGAQWYLHRGDWEVVNGERFPNGIRALADDAHARGMKFGLWCEIEGLGEKAALAAAHPEFAARRDGQPLGYVCFGSPAVQAWAYRTLSRLIREYACDWIKLDFNVDPEAGCNRIDHGHDSGDGLYEHYQGYYGVLERIRSDFPEVVLENCSSGGLRIDLGMLRQTHVTFLSDPDWAVHDLQIFWGATLMLAPDVCLHWSFSEWRAGNGPQQQNFNPRDPGLKPHKLDYYTRISMLGLCGFSQKLPELPDWVARRLAEHIRIYRGYVRRFVGDADLYRLTEQPRRDGQGERWCAFQYSLTDEHLLFVFRLPDAEVERGIRLVNLQADRLYRIAGFEGEAFAPALGRDLMDAGLVFTTLEEEDSALLRVF